MMDDGNLKTQQFMPGYCFFYTTPGGPPQTLLNKLKQMELISYRKTAAGES